MTDQFFHLSSPLDPNTPEIKHQNHIKLFKEIIFYLIVVFILYIILSNTPLYGIPLNSGTDYFYWLRVISHSNLGTLIEIVSGLIVITGLVKFLKRKQEKK
jgi:preprotein translocase subunit SecY